MLLCVALVLLIPFMADSAELSEPKFRVLTPSEITIELPATGPNLKLITFRIGVLRKNNDFEDLEKGENKAFKDNSISIRDQRLALSTGDALNYLLAYRDNDSYKAKTGTYIFDGTYYGKLVRNVRQLPLLANIRKVASDVHEAIHKIPFVPNLHGAFQPHHSGERNHGFEGHGHQDGFQGHEHQNGFQGHGHGDGFQGHGHGDGFQGHGHGHHDGFQGHGQHNGFQGHGHGHQDNFQEHGQQGGFHQGHGHGFQGHGHGNDGPEEEEKPGRENGGGYNKPNNNFPNNNNNFPNNNNNNNNFPNNNNNLPNRPTTSSTIIPPKVDDDGATTEYYPPIDIRMG